MGGFDGGAVVGEDAGFGEMSGFGGQVAGAGGFVAMQRGEVLDDLGAAAMAVEVAEAADVHENDRSGGRRRRGRRGGSRRGGRGV